MKKLILLLFALAFYSQTSLALSDSEDEDENAETFNDEIQEECPICKDKMHPLFTRELSCRHSFHRACIERSMERRSSMADSCPLCRSRNHLSDQKARNLYAAYHQRSCEETQQTFITIRQTIMAKIKAVALHKSYLSDGNNMQRLGGEGYPLINSPIDRFSNTILHWFTYTNELQLFTLAIELGADVNYFLTQGPLSGSTALHSASQHGHLDFVRLLLQRGANINPTINSGEYQGATPLHFAAREGHTNVVRHLLSQEFNGQRVNINGQTQSGHTPLHYAVLLNRRSTVRVLLENGANPHLRDHNNLRAFDLARMNNHYDLEATLRHSLQRDESFSWRPVIIATSALSAIVPVLAFLIFQIDLDFFGEKP